MMSVMTLPETSVSRLFDGFEALAQFPATIPSHDMIKCDYRPVTNCVRQQRYIDRAQQRVTIDGGSTNSRSAGFG
jgi:hypothetical protein